MSQETAEAKQVGIDISRYPVMYVYFQDEQQFNQVLTSLDFCAEGEKQAALSAGYFNEQIDRMVEDGEEIPEEIQEVAKAIETDGFDGDIWFYA